jgi:flagellum-specific ATP synthase
MTNIIDTTHKEAALKFRKYYASYEENVDLINIGAYAKGANEDLDFAVENIKHFKEFLHQAVEQNINLPDAINQLKGVVLR